MLKVKYVEAMIGDDREGGFVWNGATWRGPDGDPMVDALDAMDEEHKGSLSAKAVRDAFENYEQAVDDHDCADGWPSDDGEASLFIPVGQAFTIAQQIERAGFLRSEEVAIIRLADLKALIAACGAEAKVA